MQRGIKVPKMLNQKRVGKPGLTKPGNKLAIRNLSGSLIMRGTIDEWRGHVRKRKDRSNPFS